MDAFWLTLPVMGGFLALVLAFVLKGGRPLMAPMSLISVQLTGYDIGGWFQYIPRAALRLALIAVSLACFYYPSIRDYSVYFPRRFDIAVYFDGAGLRAALGHFPRGALARLNVPSDWAPRRLKYFKEMNADLKTITPPFVFSVKNDATFGHGEGTLDVATVAIEW